MVSFNRPFQPPAAQAKLSGLQHARLYAGYKLSDYVYNQDLDKLQKKNEEERFNQNEKNEKRKQKGKNRKRGKDGDGDVPDLRDRAEQSNMMRMNLMNVAEREEKLLAEK